MSTSNFESLRPVLQPALDLLELERQRVRRTTAITAIWAGLAALFIIGGATILLSGFHSFVVFMPLVLAAIAVGWVYTRAAKEYRSGFKTLVMPHLVHSFGEFSYDQNNGIRENEFRACQMFRSPDRYQCEDLVMGRVGETSLRFSEVHAEYRTESTDSRGHRRTEWHTIFKGVFVIADFNKNFNGLTLVLPDTAEKFLGRFGQKLQSIGASFSGRELVKLEDPEFEKCFVVYSRDQIEARYLLSPSMMRRLLDFRSRCKSGFHLSFLANHIYLAIPLQENWFEPPLGRALDMDALAPYAQQMQFALGIVEDLDLNTRIWSKQSAAPPSATPLPFDPLSPAAPNAPMQHRWE